MSETSKLDQMIERQSLHVMRQITQLAIARIALRYNADCCPFKPDGLVAERALKEINRVGKMSSKRLLRYAKQELPNWLDSIINNKESFKIT